MAFEKLELKNSRVKKYFGDVRAAVVFLNKGKNIYIRFNITENILNSLQWKDNISLDVFEGNNEDLGLLRFSRVIGDSGLKITKEYKSNNYDFRLNTGILKYNNIKNVKIGIHDLTYQVEGSVLTVMLSPQILAANEAALT